jgi:flavin-dependent dehydrogenase
MKNLYNKLSNVVIVGGGSAGWMTATHFSNALPELKITLVESPNHPIIGVGESTIGGISNWLALQGLDKLPFLSKTDGTIKLSIRFEDFYRKGDGGFYYPFGKMAVGEKHNLNNNNWFWKKHLYPNTPVSDFADCYYSQMAMVNANTMSETFPDFNYQSHKAVHFDATKFGQWLKKNVCIPNGVKHILKEVKQVVQDEDEYIDHLVLDDREKIEADLFIDCTGFKSLLLGETLKEPFVDFSPILPNNKAWATKIPYKSKQKEICSYTNCTAIDNGWIWKIPLWSRWGTGYVYSDKYVSDEDALNEFKKYLYSKGYTNQKNYKFKNIKMRVGRHKRVWVKNVLAIGLSAGFIEPLESNGLYSVHEFLNCFFSQMESRFPYVNNIDRENVNYECCNQFDSFSKFVTMHYALSARDDTEYWRDIQRKDWEHVDPLPDDNGMHYWKSLWKRYWVSGHWDNEDGMNCISAGMHWQPWGFTRQKIQTGIGDFNFYKNGMEQVTDRLNTRKKDWNFQAKKLPSTYKFLKNKWYNKKKERIYK